MMGPVETVIALSATALAKIEAEDTAVVILRFKSGALGVIEATTAVRPKDLEGSISILGEYGSVEIGGFAVNQMKVWNFVKTQPDDNEVMAKYSVNPPNVYGFGHKAYYDHVVACLCDGALSPVDSKEGRKSVELINAIYESIETGKEVRVGEVHHTTRLGQHAS
jgi:UDP-N-acetyl-2-amino-2-deoxyglucuronate dehydrogenase